MRLQPVGALGGRVIGSCGVTACLSHNEPTSYASLARLSPSGVLAAAKASLNRAGVGLLGPAVSQRG